MANTIKYERWSIEITDIDSDWTWTDTLPNYRNGIRVDSIQFTPIQTNDRCVFLDGIDEANSPPCFDVICADEWDQKIRYYNGRPLHLFLDFSLGLYTAGTAIHIQMAEV